MIFVHQNAVSSWFFNKGYTYLFIIQPPRSTRDSSHLSPSRPPVSTSSQIRQQLLNLRFYVASGPWNDLPTDLLQFAHTTLSPINIRTPPLALYPAAFHSR